GAKIGGGLGDLFSRVAANTCESCFARALNKHARYRTSTMRSQCWRRDAAVPERVGRNRSGNHCSVRKARGGIRHLRCERIWSRGVLRGEKGGCAGAADV